MGRKRSGPRQLVYLFPAGLIFCILLGCSSEGRRVNLQMEPAAPSFPKEPISEQNPWEALDRARGFFQQGNYEASLAENLKVLDWARDNVPSHRALFNMGLIYAHGANPRRDPRTALLYFHRVIEEFSQNPLAEEAKAWISLLQKNLDLTKEVVDLTQENVALIQEKEGLRKENIRLSQMAEKQRLQAEALLAARDQSTRPRVLLDQGNFEAAIEENQRVLAHSGKNASKDRALFQIGLIYAASRNPRRDLDKSLSYFLRLAKEYPQSPFTDEAKGMIELLQENQRLNRMIEKSKEVDIAIEEKKREKGR